MTPALEWVERYCDTMEDVPSLRHMHRFLREALEKDAGIRAEIVEKHSEALAVREWDDPSQIDLDQKRRDGMARIEKRLKEIGAEL